MAYCTKCGTQLSDGAKFCPKCGTSVSPVKNDNGGKLSSKKIVIPLVISLLLLAFIGGGYYIYQQKKKEEVRKEEEIRIKAEKQRKAEELKKEKERKKAEELATPIGVFYNQAKGNHLWSSSVTHKYWEGNYANFFFFELAFYFYPSSKTTGRVSIYQYQDEKGQIVFLNDKESQYEIIGNTIIISDYFDMKIVNDIRPCKFKLEIIRKSEYTANLKDQNNINYYNTSYKSKFSDKYKN